MDGRDFIAIGRLFVTSFTIQPNDVTGGFASLVSDACSSQMLVGGLNVGSEWVVDGTVKVDGLGAPLPPGGRQVVVSPGAGVQGGRRRVVGRPRRLRARGGRGEGRGGVLVRQTQTIDADGEHEADDQGAQVGTDDRPGELRAGEQSVPGAHPQAPRTVGRTRVPLSSRRIRNRRRSRSTGAL